MSYHVSILTEAEDDIDNAYIWYELRQLELGKKFYNSVEESAQFLSQNPFSFQEVYKGVRRCVIKRFPYGIYYYVNTESKEILIIGVIHFKRSSGIIKKRM